MGECTSDLPTVAAIELDRGSIRLNDAKLHGFIAAGEDFSFPLREQTLTDPMSTAFAKHP